LYTGAQHLNYREKNAVEQWQLNILVLQADKHISKKTPNNTNENSTGTKRK
jgi:hypothetical protein